MSVARGVRRTKLIELRKERGFSQRSLASVAKIDKAFVCYIEQGQRYPGPEVTARLAAALKVPVGELVEDYLLGRDEPGSAA